MARNTNGRIRKKHLILCEGRDAEEFLITYLNSEALSKHPFFRKTFRLWILAGIQI